MARETAGTLKLLRRLADASLAQAVTPGGRTLGRLVWHIVLSLPEMARHAGLTVAGPDGDAPVPSAAVPGGEVYEQAAREVARRSAPGGPTPSFGDEIPMYGGVAPGCRAVRPDGAPGAPSRADDRADAPGGTEGAGVYGPSREEWAAIGLPPQE